MQKYGNSLQSWMMWILAASFFMFGYVARLAPSVMVPDMMRAFNASAFSLGTVSAFFYYAYIGMQLPASALFDFFSTRLLLTIATCLCGISYVLFAFTNSIFAAEIYRFILGFGSAFAFVGALKTAGQWLPPQRFGLLASSTQAMGMLGAALGTGCAAVLTIHFGWRQTLILIGVVLLLLAVSLFIVLRDHKPTHITSESSSTEEPSSVWQNFVQLLRNPQLWINGLVIGCLFAPTAAFAEFWGTSYLTHVQGLHFAIAANAVGTIFIGWAVGGPITGWLSDFLQKRKPILVFTGILSLLFLSLVLFLPHIPATMIFILLFCYGFCNSGMAISYTVSKEISPVKTSATAIGFTNMASILIGSALQPLIGLLLDLNWKHKMVNGVRFYSSANYHTAISILPICFVIALIAVIFLKESYGTHFLKAH